MTPEQQNQILTRWAAEHGAMLHHLANGFADGPDRDDLLQDLLLALWRAIPHFRSDSKESTFIYRVAHNAALTWRRARASYRARLERFSEQAQADSPDPRPSEDRQSEALAHVYAAIRQLPPLDRSLVLLQLDALSYSEIAAIHGLSESNVGARLTRIKQKLTLLTKEIFDELR